MRRAPFAPPASLLRWEDFRIFPSRDGCSVCFHPCGFRRVFSPPPLTGGRGFAACVLSSCARPCRLPGLAVSDRPCGRAFCSALATKWTSLLHVTAASFTSLFSSVSSCKRTAMIMKPLWVFFCNKLCWSQPDFIAVLTMGILAPWCRQQESGVPAWDLPGFMVKGWG